MNLVKKASSDLNLFWNIFKDKGFLEALKADYKRAKKEMNEQGYQHPIEWFHNFLLKLPLNIKNITIKLMEFFKEKVSLGKIISFFLVGSLFLIILFIGIVWYIIIGFLLSLILLKIISFIF